MHSNHLIKHTLSNIENFWDCAEKVWSPQPSLRTKQPGLKQALIKHVKVPGNKGIRARQLFHYIRIQIPHTMYMQSTIQDDREMIKGIEEQLSLFYKQDFPDEASRHRPVIRVESDPRLDNNQISYCFGSAIYVRSNPHEQPNYQIHYSFDGEDWTNPTINQFKEQKIQLIGGAATTNSSMIKDWPLGPDLQLLMSFTEDFAQITSTGGECQITDKDGYTYIQDDNGELWLSIENASGMEQEPTDSVLRPTSEDYKIPLNQKAKANKKPSPNERIAARSNRKKDTGSHVSDEANQTQDNQAETEESTVTIIAGAVKPETQDGKVERLTPKETSESGIYLVGLALQQLSNFKGAGIESSRIPLNPLANGPDDGTALFIDNNDQLFFEQDNQRERLQLPCKINSTQTAFTLEPLTASTEKEQNLFVGWLQLPSPVLIAPLENDSSASIGRNAIRPQSKLPGNWQLNIDACYPKLTHDQLGFSRKQLAFQKNAHHLSVDIQSQSPSYFAERNGQELNISQMQAEQQWVFDAHQKAMFITGPYVLEYRPGSDDETGISDEQA